MSEYEWLDEPSDQHDSADEELLDLGGSSRRRRWWVVVGVIVVAAVTGGILAGTLGSDSSPAAGPVRPPAPRTIEVHRTTYWEHPSTGLAVQADHDDSSILDVYMARRIGSSPACSSVRPRVEIIDETSDSVTIAAFNYSARTLPHGTFSCVYYSTGTSPAPYAAVPVRLAAPLGSRRVVDIRSGSVIGRLGTDSLPVPTYLPDGYDATFSQGMDVHSGFVALHQYQDEHAGLEIRLRSASTWGDVGTVLERDEVNGHAATVTDESYERCVSWTDDQQFVRQVCSLGPHHRFLSTEQIVRIARSMP